MGNRAHMKIIHVVLSIVLVACSAPTDPQTPPTRQPQPLESLSVAPADTSWKQYCYEIEGGALYCVRIPRY